MKELQYLRVTLNCDTQFKKQGKGAVIDKHIS
jgi:hypothetical protein